MEKTIGIIIQARVASTRLPQKMIKKIAGKTVLEHVIIRAQKVKNCNQVILATTDKKEDGILEKIAKKLNILVYRGSENDVLDRFYQAAKKFKIDLIIRITADCPLLDPTIVERVIDFYLKGNYDYVSNVRPPTFPDGMDVEVFSFQALEKSWQEAKLPSEREHVTPYIAKNFQLFKIGNITANKDFSHLRLTVDEKKDLTLVIKIYEELYNKNQFFGLNDILKLFDRKPELIKINQSINRNEGLLKSFEDDKKYEQNKKIQKRNRALEQSKKNNSRRNAIIV